MRKPFLVAEFQSFLTAIFPYISRVVPPFGVTGDVVTVIGDFRSDNLGEVKDILIGDGIRCFPGENMNRDIMVPVSFHLRAVDPCHRIGGNFAVVLGCPRSMLDQLGC